MIGLIVNPRAGAVSRDPRIIERLQGILGDQGVLETPANPEALTSALSSFRSLGCDVVATCGGDGTNVFVLTALARVWNRQRLPRFALLRGGTINIVAKNLGIRGEPEAILARLVANRRHGAPSRFMPIDLIRVQGRLGFIFGAGAPGRMLAAYYGRHGTGHTGAVRVAVHALSSALIGGPFTRSLLEPLDVQVRHDGNALGLLHPNLLVATAVADVGLGLRVGYRVRPGSGTFHALGLSVRARDLWTALVPALRGRPLTDRPLFDAVAKRLHIESREPLPCLLDGEAFSASNLTVDVDLQVEFEVA